MNRFITRTLAHRSVRAITARLLTTVPGAWRCVHVIGPPAEKAFVAFSRSLLAVPAFAPTACAGWTVHELTAHLTAGSAEIADLIELELAGNAARPTREFEEREAPFRALPPDVLRRSFFEESLRLTVALERLRAIRPEARVRFTGAALDVDTLILHAESELVVHRWDIEGADDIGVELLSDPRITVHAATAVAGMSPNVLPRRSKAASSAVVMRALDGPDIVVGPHGEMSIAATGALSSLPVIECHPAVRTLLLWGRLPDDGLPAPTGTGRVVSEALQVLTNNSSVRPVNRN
jgi:uncharacterized protein (TIGR03083 family)